MKQQLTPREQQADFDRITAIFILLVWGFIVFKGGLLIALGVIILVGAWWWARVSFLNIEDIIAARAEWEEPPYVDSYDEYRQTGVDRRKAKEAKPDNPGQLCQPCEFTGVVTDAERNAFDWPNFETPKNK